MNRIEKTVNGVHVIAERFSGIHEFLNMYENKPVSETYKFHGTAAVIQDKKYNNERKEFTTVSGYPEAVDQFKNGVNVAAMKTARAAAVTGTKKQTRKTVNGGRVCVPAYLNGSPACMRRRCKMPAKTELNIVVDMTVSWRTTPQQITKAGQLIVKYVTDAEAVNNVNLTAAHAISFKKDRSGKFKDCYVCGIRIKDAGKPFSAARVSFCLTSPAFLRVFGFLWTTRADGVPYSEGLGTVTSSNIDQEREIMKSVYKNAVTISLSEVIKNGERALPKVK